MMNLTAPQARLLARVAQKPLNLRGSELRTAHLLAQKGLVSLTIGGSGIPFQGQWWYEGRITEAGRRANAPSQD